MENENEFSKTKGGKFKIKDLDESTIYIHSNDSIYNENTLKLDIDELYLIINSKIDNKLL